MPKIQLEQIHKSETNKDILELFKIKKDDDVEEYEFHPLAQFEVGIYLIDILLHFSKDAENGDQWIDADDNNIHAKLIEVKNAIKSGEMVWDDDLEKLWRREIRDYIEDEVFKDGFDWFNNYLFEVSKYTYTTIWVGMQYTEIYYIYRVVTDDEVK